jgi:hypothetical protein
MLCLTLELCSASLSYAQKVGLFYSTPSACNSVTEICLKRNRRQWHLFQHMVTLRKLAVFHPVVFS